MKKIVGAMCVAAALTLSACGGGGDRPTVDEVSKALTSKDNVLGTAIPKEAADCLAKAFVDSDLSNKTLNAIVEGDEDYKGSNKEKDALNGVMSDLTKCMTAN